MSTVEQIAPLVGIMAAERTASRPDLYEDARQEGLIAAWRLESTHPDASPAYRATVARRAVGDVLRGRPMFGAESHRGKQDAHGEAVPLISRDGEYVTDPGYTDTAYDRVINTHLRDAVADLGYAERRYLFLRFWEGYTVKEAAAELGVSPYSLEAMWRRIRPTLREAVAA